MSIWLATLLLGTQANYDPTSCDVQQFESQRSAKLAAIVAEARQLLDESKTVIAQRDAIAARRVELSEMNPAKQALKGTFDPRYNAKDLAGRDKLLSDRLGLILQRADLLRLEQLSLNADREAFYSRCKTSG